MWTRLELLDQYKTSVAEELIMVLYFERDIQDATNICAYRFGLPINHFSFSNDPPAIINVQQYINFKGERCRVINDEEINNGIDKYV